MKIEEFDLLKREIRKSKNQRLFWGMLAVAIIVSLTTATAMEYYRNGGTNYTASLTPRQVETLVSQKIIEERSGGGVNVGGFKWEDVDNGTFIKNTTGCSLNQILKVDASGKMACGSDNVGSSSGLNYWAVYGEYQTGNASSGGKMNMNMTIINVTTLNIESSATLGWGNLTDYPSACAAGTAVSTIGDTLTCSSYDTGNSSTQINTAANNSDRILNNLILKTGFPNKLGYDNLTACADTQILKMSGANWACAADATGSSSGTNYFAVYGEYVTGNASSGGKMNMNMTIINVTTLNIENSATLGWGNLTDYPAACGAGLAIGTLGDTPVCINVNTGNSSTEMLTGINLSSSLVFNDIKSHTWTNVSITISQISDIAGTYVEAADWTTIDNYPSACTGTTAVQTIGDTLICINTDTGNSSSQMQTAINSSDIILNSLYLANGMPNGLGWQNLTSYPAACAAGSAISTLGDTPTCINTVTGNSSNEIGAAINDTDVRHNYINVTKKAEIYHNGTGLLINNTISGTYIYIPD